MEISSAAWPIYNRVLARCEDQEKAGKLFELASKGEEGGVEDLGEEEARGVEETLECYDQMMLSFLDLKTTSLPGLYEEEEIDWALGEYQAWQECAEAEEKSRTYKLEDFVRNYPQSVMLPKAYSQLGQIYANQTYEYDKAVAIHEKLWREYPSTAQAGYGLFALMKTYFWIGDYDQALFCGQQWLGRPVYQPQEAQDYESLKTMTLYFLLDGYLEGGKMEEAAETFQTIIGREGTSATRVMETGRFYKMLRLERQAEYLFYEKKDYPAARMKYDELFSLADPLQWPQYAQLAAMALKEMELRENPQSSRALQILADLKKKGEAKDFLRCQGYSSGLLGLPPDTYLQFLFLSACTDVETVALFSFNRVEQADPETKTLRTCYVVAFKRYDGWQVIDQDGFLNLTGGELAGEDLEGVMEKLKGITGESLSFVATATNRLFARSLRDLHDRERLSPYGLLLELEEQRLSRQSLGLVHNLAGRINGKERYRDKLLSLTRAFSLLPEDHFDGLRGVDFDWSSKKKCGEYSRLLQTINLACSTSSSAVHEVGHHWDDSVAVGYDGGNQTAGDVSLIFYGISWSQTSLLSSGSAFIDACWGASDPDACAVAFDPTNGWERRSGFEVEDFAEAYGMADGFEDLVTSGVSYVEGSGRLSRKAVRRQMVEGNFEPAAKYLFHKYLRSFDPFDGLCFEYGLSAEDPALTLKEVKDGLVLCLNEHSGSVAPSTLEAIKAIEDTYETWKILRTLPWDW